MKATHPMMESFAPKVLPYDWRIMPFTVEGVLTYQDTSGLRVLFSVSKESDDRSWIHVSVSRRDRIPDWSDLRTVKAIFIGEDRKAIQVLPPKSEYVNVHPRVLHLWSCLDADPLPDFRDNDGLI